MKKNQSPKQQKKTRANRKPVQELTEEQLQQVVGGVPPGPNTHPGVSRDPTAVE
jgi:bacteriocin-like protein